MGAHHRTHAADALKECWSMAHQVSCAFRGSELLSAFGTLVAHRRGARGDLAFRSRCYEAGQEVAGVHGIHDSPLEPRCAEGDQATARDKSRRA